MHCHYIYDGGNVNCAFFIQYRLFSNTQYHLVCMPASSLTNWHIGGGWGWGVTFLELFWNLSETWLKFFCNYSEIIPKLFWNYSENILKLFWNFSLTFLRLFLRFFSETFLKLFLKLFWDCSGTFLLDIVNLCANGTTKLLKGTKVSISENMISTR